MLLRQPHLSDELRLATITTGTATSTTGTATSTTGTATSTTGTATSTTGSATTERTLIVGARVRLLLRLPPSTNDAIEAVDALSASLQRALAPALAPPSTTLILEGDTIAALELAREMPTACRVWVLGAVVGASALLLVLVDPVATWIVISTNLASGSLLLGVLALLPPAMNAAQLSWALVAATALTHAPAFMVAALASQEPVEEVRFKGTEGSSSLEISALGVLTSPLLFSFGVSVLGMLPLCVLAPLASLRCLTVLMLAALSLGLAAALIVVPLLHALVRRPPRPPPPPPPPKSRETSADRLGGNRSLHSSAPSQLGGDRSLLTADAPRTVYATFGTETQARNLRGGAGGSLMAEWVERGSVCTAPGAQGVDMGVDYWSAK